MQLKYRGKVWEGPGYMSGWVYGAILCETMKRAVEEVGYENVDGLRQKEHWRVSRTSMLVGWRNLAMDRKTAGAAAVTQCTKYEVGR